MTTEPSRLRQLLTDWIRTDIQHFDDLYPARLLCVIADKTNDECRTLALTQHPSSPQHNLTGHTSELMT